MNVANTIKKLGLEQAFDYLYKDPENNLLKLMNWVPYGILQDIKRFLNKP